MEHDEAQQEESQRHHVTATTTTATTTVRTTETPTISSANLLHPDSSSLRSSLEQLSLSHKEFIPPHFSAVYDRTNIAQREYASEIRNKFFESMIKSRQKITEKRRKTDVISPETGENESGESGFSYPHSISSHSHTTEKDEGEQQKGEQQKDEREQQKRQHHKKIKTKIMAKSPQDASPRASVSGDKSSEFTVELSDYNVESDDVLLKFLPKQTMSEPKSLKNIRYLTSRENSSSSSRQEWQDNNEITTAMTTTATTLNVAPKISKKIINMKDSKIIEIPELEIQETLEPEEIPEPEIQEISEENPAIVINLDKIQPAFRQKYRRFDDIDRPCQLCDDESRENLVELCPLHKEHTFHSICLKNEIEKFEEQLKNLTCQRCHSYINKHRLQHEDLQRKKNNLDVLKNMLIYILLGVNLVLVISLVNFGLIFRM